MQCLLSLVSELSPRLHKVTERHKLKIVEECAGAVCLIGTRTLLEAPGLTTRSKKLLGAPGIATRSKDATTFQSAMAMVMSQGQTDLS